MMVTKRAHGIDPPAKNKSDIDFVILKASQGDFIDPNFNDFYPTAEQYPFRGAYHYYITSKVEINLGEGTKKGKPPENVTTKKGKKSSKKTKKGKKSAKGNRKGKNSAKGTEKIYLKDGYDWEEQAKQFLKVVDGKDIHFFALDIERNPGSEFYVYDEQKNIKSKGKNKFTNAEIQNIKMWVEFIKKHKPGIPVMLYTSADIYNTELLPHGGEILKDLDLWIARYPERPNRNEDDPFDEFLIKGVNNWQFWQYSANNNQKGPDYGVAERRPGKKQKDVDLNVFNGSVEEMRKWLGLDPETKPPGVPPDVPVTKDQSLVEIISQLDKIELAGIKPNVQIIIQQDEFDIEQITSLVAKLKDAGVTPEVNINIPETIEN
ncbi:GH25 family lysozyme [Chloroflexota bacterium]